MYVQKYKGDRVKLKKELSKYLTIHTFYSITEFLKFGTNKGNVWWTIDLIVNNKLVAVAIIKLIIALAKTIKLMME